ncbi:class I SAM-dependent methyltransferase [Tissierella sp. MB52-C2]|uniref:class I SAM-dependent methyltransferase n=1 Tax=Tissierella sp. MB52-C2 TaxID=3070999 RepID=UPI00280A7282|nr:class I SAM-dependent methyltransferase [Tissierella sp. MB52-C2]WMM26493.1 class I SAM-dependent methyltransferase [Tissierella sp. MB52-C2]
MRYSEIINTLKIVKDMIYKCVKDGQVVVDCTVGNGNDTILLARLVGKTGRVYGFDIQKKALDITKESLACENLDNDVRLIHDGHENIDLYIKEKVDFIIYNLGYLPKGNKNIKTNKDTTLKSLRKAINILNDNGIILITCYIGHEGGLEEKEEVERFLKSLDQKQFNVVKYDFINQINYPPILYGVEKSKTRRE